MIKTIIEQLKNSRSLTLISNGIRTTIGLIKPKIMSIGTAFLPAFVQNNIFGITAMDWF